MSAKGVFIWGSCVSRDTFEHVDPADYQLAKYVARQSAVSATSRPVEMISPPKLPSRFQQRMVAGDFSSSLEREFAEHGGKVDLVLIDLVDERLGFHVLPDGTVLTRSVEFIRAGGDEMLPVGSRHVPFGSAEHFDRWSQAISQLSEWLPRHMPAADVVLLDIPWAATSQTGVPTPKSFGLDAKNANKRYRRYARTAERALVARTVTLPASTVTSGPTHPWGESPFHFAEDVYLRAVEAITGEPGRSVWVQQTMESSVRPAPGLSIPHSPVGRRHPRLTVNLLAKSIAEHGWSVGDHTFGEPKVVGAGRATLSIGKYCWFGHAARLLLTQRRTDTVSLYSFRMVEEYWHNGDRHRPEMVSAPIQIGNDVRISAGAEIRPGVRIGDGALIGRKCVVMKDVPPYAIVEGIPGVVVGYRFTHQQIETLLKIAWWDWPEDDVEAALPAMAEGVPAFLKHLGES